MRYAKLINNYPSYAPRKLRIGNAWVYNPTDEQLLSEGYLPVIEIDQPEAPDGYYMESHWAERDGQIVQVWEAVELPPEPDDITPDEALTRYANELTGQNDPDLLSAAETLIKQRMEES